MKDIIDIHGQHENQTLLDENTHIKYLDNFAGNKLKDLKEKYYKMYKKYREIKEEISKNFGDDKEKRRELDLLKYQNKEIEEAMLKQGEEEELENIRQKILNSEKISKGLEETSSNINEVAIDAISLGIRALEKIEGIDKKYGEALNNLKSIYYDIQELSRDIEEYRQDTYFDEQKRNDIETRLDLIYKLKRKYGNSVEEILKYNNEIENRIEKIENSEEYVNNLKQKLRHLSKEMEEIANQINKIRNKEAKTLKAKINSELKDLEMPNARFEVQIIYDENRKFKAEGLDKVEFTICTNIGEEQKALTKIASGGEMSRIMLAIKNVLADIDKVGTMIFDEIDTGISGIAAKATGEKLKAISKNHQVLCVTHLANIAAKGDYNYFINKQIKENRTKTNIKRLTEEETINEIARIASGNLNEIAIQHAKALRKIA